MKNIVKTTYRKENTPLKLFKNDIILTYNK
jgi:hypothetical protein